MRNGLDMTIVPLPATIIGRKALSADTTLYRLTLESSEGDRFDSTPGNSSSSRCLRAVKSPYPWPVRRGSITASSCASGGLDT